MILIQNTLFLALIAILRPIIQPIDILFLIFALLTPENQEQQSHTIQQFIITALIASFIADSPLGLLPLISAVTLLLGYRLTPLLVNRGVSRYIIWQSQLLFIFMTEQLLRNLLNGGIAAIQQTQLRVIIVTLLLSIAISFFVKKKRI